MDNFTYCNPVKIVFGKGTIAKLNELIEPKAKILLTYGGGSIKKNGVYRQVMYFYILVRRRLRAPSSGYCQTDIFSGRSCSAGSSMGLQV
jgi:hypothetical protein